MGAALCMQLHMTPSPNDMAMTTATGKARLLCWAYDELAALMQLMQQQALLYTYM